MPWMESGLGKLPWRLEPLDLTGDVWPDFDQIHDRAGPHPHHRQTGLTPAPRRLRRGRCRDGS